MGSDLDDLYADVRPLAGGRLSRTRDDSVHFANGALREVDQSSGFQPYAEWRIEHHFCPTGRRPVGGDANPGYPDDRRRDGPLGDYSTLIYRRTGAGTQPNPEKFANRSAISLERFPPGLRYVMGWPGLRWLLGIALVVNFLLTPTSSLMPLLVTEHFSGGALQLGWIQSALGVGVIAGGLLLGTWGGFWFVVTSLLIYNDLYNMNIDVSSLWLQSPLPDSFTNGVYSNPQIITENV